MFASCCPSICRSTLLFQEYPLSRCEVATPEFLTQIPNPPSGPFASCCPSFCSSSASASRPTPPPLPQNRTPIQTQSQTPTQAQSSRAKSLNPESLPPFQAVCFMLPIFLLKFRLLFSTDSTLSWTCHVLREHGVFGVARGPLTRMCASRAWADFVQPAVNGMGIGVALGGEGYEAG